MARLPKAGPLRVLVLLEALGIARDHLNRLSPAERQRLLELLRTSGGRPSNLSARQRDELSKLVRKLELGQVPRKLAPLLSPVGGRGGLLRRRR